jgi:hypothetical protein
VELIVWPYFLNGVPVLRLHRGHQSWTLRRSAFSAVALIRYCRRVTALDIRPSTHSRLGRHHAHDGLLIRRRGSEIQFDGDRLWGLSADAGVLIPGFSPEVEWFSCIWGVQADDMLALEIDESVSGPLPRERHEGTQPIGHFVDGVREYRLDEALRERLGIVLDDAHSYRIEAKSAIRREVNFHDDCFWSVEPVDDVTLKAMVLQHLALHEEYVGCEGGFASRVEPLCDLLRTGVKVSLTSTRPGVLRASFGPRGFLGGRSQMVWPVQR